MTTIFILQLICWSRAHLRASAACIYRSWNERSSLSYLVKRESRRDGSSPQEVVRRGTIQEQRGQHLFPCLQLGLQEGWADAILQPVTTYQLPHLAQRGPFRRSLPHSPQQVRVQPRCHLLRVWLLLPYPDLSCLQAANRPLPSPMARPKKVMKSFGFSNKCITFAP